ncbi:hypothetical protein Acr_17g0003990 [Actinidia rufa]|uniref:Uncharacterized protein n=1 Tax=Actinidia rufa TaxID=165716 RepID=A0A7J0G209_9ERIC|nr:hypothetical protein Acr_17g0003990 [Actinidia rufa]
MFPFVFQPSARLDVPAVPLLDRLWFGACRYAPTVVSKAFCHASHLLSPDIPQKLRRLSSFVQASNTVIVPSSLTSGTLDVTKALAQTVPLIATVPSSGGKGLRACCPQQLNGDHCPSKAGVPSNVNRTPEQGRLSLLTSDSPSEVPALVRPSDVIMYFVPLHFLSLSGFIQKNLLSLSGFIQKNHSGFHLTLNQRKTSHIIEKQHIAKD